MAFGKEVNWEKSWKAILGFIIIFWFLWHCQVKHCILFVLNIYHFSYVYVLDHQVGN